MFGHLSFAEVEAVARGIEPPAHLSGCSRCLAKVRRARGRVRLLASLPAQVELPEQAFRRVERRLREAQVSPSPQRPRWLLPAFGLAAVAALLLLALFWQRPVVEPLARPLAPAPAVAQLVLPTAVATVTLVQGEGQWRAGGSSTDEGWRALRAGVELGERNEVRTAGRLALALREGRGFVLGGASGEARLAIEELRVGRSQVALERGTLVVSTTPLAAHEALVVRAGGREVRALGTAFSVTRVAAELVVEVQHGAVLVSDGPVGRPVRVGAPGRLRLSDGVGVAAVVVEALDAPAAEALAAQPEYVLAAGGAPPWVQLDVLDLPAGAEVDVDGLGFGPGPLSGLFPPGSHRVRARLQGKLLRESWVTLAPNAPAAVVRLGQAGAPLRPKARVEEEKVRERLSLAVKGHMRQLRACYQRWLKQDFKAAGQVTLSLRLSEDGVVEAAHADGAVLSQAAARCFADEASTWELPALGAPQVIEIPLVLTPQ